MFRIFRLADCPTVPMNGERGEKMHLINAEIGAEKLDVHMNSLRVGDPGGGTRVARVQFYNGLLGDSAKQLANIRKRTVWWADLDRRCRGDGRRV